MATTADKIALNNAYAERHGWRGPGEIVAGATVIDAEFVKGVHARQNALSIGADGICGPATYSAVLADHQARLRSGDAVPGIGLDKLARAGLIAVCELKRLWLRDIEDLPSPKAANYEACRSTIDQLIRTSLGIGWAWRPEYERDKFEFCGTGPAYGWRAAGMPLKPHRYWFFASTLRLDDWGSYQPWEDTPNPRPPAGVDPRMMIELDEHSTAKDAVFPDGTLPRAGDIVIMGGAETGPGQHIATAEHFYPNRGEFITLECNGTGLSPSGRTMHGIIRATRRIGLGKSEPRTRYHVRRVIRPGLADIA